MLTMLKSLLLQLVPIIVVKAPTDSELSQAVSNSPITDGSSSQIVKFYQEWGPHLHVSQDGRLVSIRTGALDLRF